MTHRPTPVYALLAALLALQAPAGLAATPLSSKGMSRVQPAELGDRLALVIGNKDYAKLPLVNPVNDARAMKAALELKQVGFRVIYKENLSLPGMNAAVREFVQGLNRDTVGLVYFSGHGAQVDGANYLIPVGADIRSPSELKAYAYDAGILLDEMKDAGNRVNIVILDACRNNPFKGFRAMADGLASMSGPNGSLIAFATAPGHVAADGTGGNGTYTKHLVRALVQPGLKIEDMFKQVREAVSKETGGAQVPWENTSLFGDFCFAGCAAKPAAPTPTPTQAQTAPSPPLPQAPNEMTGLWRSEYTGWLIALGLGMLGTGTLAVRRVSYVRAKKTSKSNVVGGINDSAMQPSRVAGLNLSHQKLRGQSFAQQRLRNANFTYADLTEAVLIGCDLRGANLVNAMLRHANLDQADLRWADLRGADLSGARLLQADLRGAKLDRAKLRRAKLLGAQLDELALTGCDTFGAALPGMPLRAWVSKGGENDINTVAWHPNGNILAVACDRAVVLWDSERHVELGACIGHTNWIKSVAFSSDGTLLASASDDKTVKLWSVADMREVACLLGHEEKVNAVAFSPDGTTLASASWDSTVRLWTVADGRETARLLGHESWINAVAFSPDGTVLASASRDKTVRLWSVANKRETARLHGHRAPVRSVMFSPDGAELASGSEDCMVGVWSVANGREIAWLGGHKGWIYTVVFSPDGATLASASYDKTVRLWSADSGQKTVLLKHEDYVTGVAFSPDGTMLATASNDNTVRLWSAADARETALLLGHEASVVAVAFSPDGKLLASASWDNTVRLWDVKTQQCLYILGHLPSGWVAYTPDGRYKLGGEFRGGFWHSAGLCRFEPGELDAIIPGLRLADDAPLLPGLRHGR